MNVTSLEKIKLLWQSHVFCIQLAKYMSNTCFGLYWYIYIITYAHVPRVTRVYFGIMVSCSSFPGCSHKSMWIWTITLSINHPIYIYSPRSLHCLIIGEYMVDHVPVGILSNTIYGSHHAQEHSAIWCNAYVNSTCVFCSKKNTFDMIIIIECSWIFNMKKYHTMRTISNTFYLRTHVFLNKLLCFWYWIFFIKKGNVHPTLFIDQLVLNYFLALGGMIRILLVHSYLLEY